ncbi:MAG: toprim domain-containing protein, partial [Patescibacteria group bacterium]|nr:toprim domain-containing protein [Patescibacteria group bacterium]
MADRRFAPQSAIDQFLDAIAEKGITPPDRIEMDGKIHRFSSNGRPDDDAGWYVFHNNAIPTGSFGDFRTGQAVGVWVANMGRPITPAETAEIRKQQTEANNERAEKDRQLQAEARSKAYRIMRRNTLPGVGHPYLARKNVGAHGLSVWDDPKVSIGYSRKDGKPILQIASQDDSVQLGFKVKLGSKTEEEFLRPWQNILIVPMMDDKYEIQSLQFISEDGDKKFLYGGKMQGSRLVLGDLKDSETILIAEGYATAATIHEITGHPVVVAYNAGNLLEVSQSIRAQKPDADIVLCADDDWKTNGNPGLTKAHEAADAINGRVLSPEFGPDRPDGATDFNDMTALYGKDAVTIFFQRNSLGRNSSMTYIGHDNDNDKTYATFSRPSSTPQQAPELPKTGRIYTGTISGFGPAPYKNDPKNSASYFITLGTGEDARTVWGVDLGKALIESGFNVGDKVAVYDKGKTPVRIVNKIRDAQGKVIGEEAKTTTRNAWHIGSYDEYVE